MMKLVAVALIAIVAHGVHGWGEVGHSTVAQLAVNRLTPSAQAKLAVFLGSSHTLPEIAPWPDQYAFTKEGAWSKDLHYANLPVGARTFVMTRDCDSAHPCVVAAIQNYTTQLTKQAQNGGTKCEFPDDFLPCPLEFVTHFVGDVHQPLHVSYSCDEGGNSIPISFYGIDSELHKTWDDLMINKWVPNYATAAKELQSMIDANPGLVKKYLSTMNPSDWANESVGYDLSTVYIFDYAGEPISHMCGYPTPANSTVPQLGDYYYNQNLPIIKQRLIAAGIRLGQLLNTVLGGSDY